jgi:hypothetical protein
MAALVARWQSLCSEHVAHSQSEAGIAVLALCASLWADDFLSRHSCELWQAARALSSTLRRFAGTRLSERLAYTATATVVSGCQPSTVVACL